MIYARPAVSRRAWALPLVGWLAATTALLLTSRGQLTGAQVVLSIVGPGALFGVWLLTLWSMNRYAAVTLTRQTLTVGRDRVAVADLEPQWVRMLAAKADPSLAQRLGTSITTLQLPGDRPDNERGRLLGGAFGTTLGDDLVTLELRGDGLRRHERVSVPTKDRRGLLAGLLTAVESAPADG